MYSLTSMKSYLNSCMGLLTTYLTYPLCSPAISWWLLAAGGRTAYAGPDESRRVSFREVIFAERPTSCGGISKTSGEVPCMYRYMHAHCCSIFSTSFPFPQPGAQ